MVDKIAVFGLHDKDLMRVYTKIFSSPRLDYKVIPATDIEAMKAVVEGLGDKVSYILMDVNLGCPNGDDPASCLEIYNIVRDRVDAGDAYFHAVSASLSAVKNAVEAGIPEEYVHDKPCSLEELLPPDV
ncbi:hypothetical protein GF345_04000 [Candidatus Woesearchaeota archaeon]|nr:hypothetical protein [Candidatus Woesearchaeota archaeon]